MDRILAAFKKWDADENGYIGEDELIRVLGALGMSEAEVHKTFEAADLNSDGRVLSVTYSPCATLPDLTVSVHESTWLHR